MIKKTIVVEISYDDNTTNDFNKKLESELGCIRNIIDYAIRNPKESNESMLKRGLQHISEIVELNKKYSLKV